MPDNIDKAEDDNNKNDNIIFKEYKESLKKEFSESYKGIIDVTEGDEHRVVIKNDTLSSENLNLLLDEVGKTTILDASGMQIHFLKLKDSLAKFCDDLPIDEKHKVEVEFITDTGNNGGYLIQVYLIIKLENPNSYIFTDPKQPIDFRIGFQFEQNKKDNGKFKFYFADLLYESNTLIKNETKTNPTKTRHSTYNAVVKEILINIFTKDYLDERGLVYGRRGSTTKSFCSFLSNYSFQNSNEIEQKFKDEIHHLISKIKSLEEHIQLLSDKINKP
jgi:hypothetical protein